MRNILDRLRKSIKVNKKLFVFLLVISLIGVIFGSFFVTIINESDKKLITDNIGEYIKNIDSNNLNYISSFKNSILSNMLYVLIIWILGISVIGIPIVIFLVFTKAFVIGFSIGSIILNYKLKGCIISFIYIFPHNIINMILLLYLATYSLCFSIKILESLLLKNSINFRQIMHKYIKVLIITLVGILLTTSFEIFVTPNIIKKFLFLIK